MTKAKVSIFRTLNSESHGSHGNKGITLANRETPVYPPFTISFVHFPDKSESYHVNN